MAALTTDAEKIDTLPKARMHARQPKRCKPFAGTWTAPEILLRVEPLLVFSR